MCARWRLPCPGLSARVRCVRGGPGRRCRPGSGPVAIQCPSGDHAQARTVWRWPSAATRLVTAPSVTHDAEPSRPRTVPVATWRMSGTSSSSTTGVPSGERESMVQWVGPESRGGGRIIQRQPVLRIPVQDAEVPAELPRPVHLDRARPRALPEVLRLVQRCSPAWRAGPAHPRRRPLRPRPGRPGRPGRPRRRPGRRLRRPPRTVRPPAAPAAEAADGLMDQQARAARRHGDARQAAAAADSYAPRLVTPGERRCARRAVTVRALFLPTREPAGKLTTYKFVHAQIIRLCGR